MRLARLTPAPPEPSASGIAGREAEWLRALREGRYACRWHRLGAVEWSTAIIVDGVRIALSYRSAIEAGRILEARLPTQGEADAMFRSAAHIEPVVVRPVSASTDAIKLHSVGVSEQLHEHRLAGELVDNEGKLWIAGAPPGRAYNYGWPDQGAPHRLGNGVRGWQPLGAAHTDGHVDYSQTLRIVRDVAGGVAVPGPIPPEATPTTLGQRGPAVAAWQRRLIAEGYDPGAPDGIHGPRTEVETAAWHRAQTPTPQIVPLDEPRIVTCAEWGARAVPIQATSPAKGIVIHHMALGSRPGQRGHMRTPLEPGAELIAAKLLARNLQASHQAQRWVDTGQHWSVTRGGVILEGRTGSLSAARRGLVVRGSHAGRAANTDHWGIEVEGDYTDGRHYGDTTPTVPPAQWDALVALVRWLLATGRLSGEAIRGHREVPGNATGCPGTLLDRLPELRAAV
jgi:hypothetical protein